jgi:hypothetical protein
LRAFVCVEYTLPLPLDIFGLRANTGVGRAFFSTAGRVWSAGIAASRTRSRRAYVALGTRVPIVARCRVVGKEAGIAVEVRRIAIVVGADIEVVANEWIGVLAQSARAMVVGRAGVAVVARRFVVDDRTATRWITPVVSTDVAVIAHQSISAYALAINAVVIDRASVTLFAISGIVGKDATRCGIAAVVRTGVVVVAFDKMSTDASALFATA